MQVHKIDIRHTYIHRFASKAGYFLKQRAVISYHRVSLYLCTRNETVGYY